MHVFKQWLQRFTTMAIIMGLWLVFTILISSVTFLTSIQSGEQMSKLTSIVFEFICISPWIVATPVLIWLARNYNFRGDRLYPSIGAHLLFALFLFTVHSVTQSYAVSLFYDMSFTKSYLQRDFIGFLDMRIMLYLGVVLAVYAVDFYKREKESKLKEPRLRAQLNKVKYQSLLNQIQPNFLLSSLGTIKKHIQDAPEQSEAILNNFSDLLRIMLQNISRPELTAREDLQNFRLYGNLLPHRLGNDIEISCEADPEVMNAVVPSFLSLLPVIEEIIQINYKEFKGIRRIAYSLKGNKCKVKLAIGIEGGAISTRRISSLQQSIHISEMSKGLQNNYGRDINLQSKIEGELFQIQLTIPYKSWTEQETYGQAVEKEYYEEKIIGRL